MKNITANTMRKLLDWIADKLGYQRKFTVKPWPLTYIPDSVMKEFEDDSILPLGHIFPNFPTQDLKVQFRLYEDDFGSPGSNSPDDLCIIED